MYRPTTRVLTVLEILQTHGRMSGPELSGRLGVDGRTMRRYIAMLEELGIPITAERGPHGGYRLMPGFKLPPMMFDRDEALALAIGLLASRGLGLGQTSPAIESAYAKLAGVMPVDLLKRVRGIEETVTLNLVQPIAPRDNDALTALSDAAHSGRTAHLRYRSASLSETERDYDPYGMIYQQGRWYVVGHCHLRAGMRSLRLDRVLEVHVTARTFPRVEGFDCLAYLTTSIATLPRAHVVEVLLETDLRSAADALFQSIGTLRATDRGVLLKSQVDDLDWYARELARIPFAFSVVGPPELRAAIKRCAVRLSQIARER